MDIGAQLAQLDARLKRMERASRLSSASLDGTALEARDDSGGLRAIVGQQADGTSGIQVVNGPPPPAPSTPIVVSVLGGVAVSWDGQFAGSAVIPLDWSRVEVHASTTAGFTPSPATLQSTIETAQGATAVVVTDDPVYVQLLARNTSGAASTPSTEAGPYGPTPVVASEVLDGIITTVKLADDAVTAAKVATGAIGTTEISDDAVTTQKIVAGAVLAGQIAAGAVLTDKLAAEAVTAAKVASLAITTGKLDALAVTSDKLAANSVIAGKIAAGTVDATAISAGAITTAKLAAGAVDATSLAADAITGKTITGGAINGSTVTGGVLQTNSSGARVVVTPTPPAGISTYPSMLLYSGVTGEVYPAILNSGPSAFNPAQGSTSLGSPITSQDSGGNYTFSALSLSSPIPGTSPGRFQLSSNNPVSTSEVGYTYIDAQSAATTAGASTITLYAKDGNSTGKHSSITTTGDSVTVNANNTNHTFNSSGLTLTGTISARNTPTIVTKAGNTDRVSTTTRTADPDLTMSLVANATYIVEFHMYIGGSSFALVVTEWLVPSGATGLKGAMGPASSATEVTAGNNNADGIAMRSGAHGFSTTATYGRRNVNTNLCYAIETGTVTTTSAGTLALGWAQSTSSTTFNRMGQGSWMRVTRIA